MEIVICELQIKTQRIKDKYNIYLKYNIIDCSFYTLLNDYLNEFKILNNDVKFQIYFSKDIYTDYDIRQIQNSIVYKHQKLKF